MRTKASCGGRRPGAVCVGCAEWFLRDDRVFPGEPVGRGLGTHVGVRRLREPRVGREEVAVTLVLRHPGSKPLPRLREVAADASVQPVDLGPPARGHARDDDLRHALRMPLGVGQDQRRSPGAAEQEPALDPEVLTESLHVCEQVLGGVRAHVGVRIACVRSAAPGAALVEEHDAIAVLVERPAGASFQTGAGPAVNDRRGLAVGIAAGLPIDVVAVAHVEHPVVVGRDSHSRSVFGAHSSSAYAAATLFGTTSAHASITSSRNSVSSSSASRTTAQL